MCNGCKTSIAGLRFVIRHSCALPYKKRDDQGVLVVVTPPQKGNHHFHLSKDCILRTHQSFNGQAVIDPTVNAATNTIRALLNDGAIGLK